MRAIQPRVSVARQLPAQQQPPSQLPTIPDKGEEEEKMVGEATKITEESMAVEGTSTKRCDTESKSTPQETLEVAEMKEPELQVQEEVVSALASEQEASEDQMETDSDPYFQPPRPPRRVSLLEYKERMKGKRKQSAEETQREETDMDRRGVEQMAVEGEVGTNEKVPGKEEEQKSDLQQEAMRDSVSEEGESEAVRKDLSGGVVSVIRGPQSTVDHQQHKGAAKKEKETLKQLLEQPITSPDSTVVEPPSKGVNPPDKVNESSGRLVPPASERVETAPSRTVETAAGRTVEPLPSRGVESSSSRTAGRAGQTAPSRTVETAAGRTVEALPSRGVDNSSSRTAQTAPGRAGETAPSSRTVESVAEPPSKVVKSASRGTAEPPSQTVESLSRMTEKDPGRVSEGSIEWPDEQLHRRKGPVSDDVVPIAQTAGEKQSGEKEAAGRERETVRETEMEDSGRSQSDRKREKDEGRERRLSDGKKKQEEMEREQEKEKRKEKEREWTKKMDDLDKDWRARREKERKVEREKRLARKIGKPVESWKPPTSFSEQIPTHSTPFSPSQPRFSIPIHPRPRFPLPIPPPAIPPPQPPPPQPFLGFTPHHAFHPSPAPAFPPPPHPAAPTLQTDVWSMFGNLFAQHNLFPTDEPPPPPPRTPSPLHPPMMHFGSPRRSPSPLRRAPSPHLMSPTHSSSPPLSPHGRNSRSPEPSPFLSARAQSSSLLPASPHSGADPKPLDAKQFKIISELIKRTTVKKCDVSVQIVPPRMISEGTQDGRGFTLRSIGVQVRARTRDSCTATDTNKPDAHHRLVCRVLVCA